MLTIYHAPGSRSVRPIWLCYELGVEFTIKRVDQPAGFRDSDEWQRVSASGKVPALTDGDLHMVESGAMVEYLLEKFDTGTLRPAHGTPASALHQQWCWFAEATLIRPLGLYRLLRAKGEDIDVLVGEAQTKFHAALQAVESNLSGQEYMLGNTFGAVDVMMGYSISILERLLDDRYPNVRAYLQRIQTREAYQQALTEAG